MEHSYDLFYLATGIANLAGAPVRLYEDGEKVFTHFVSPLSIDPIALVESEILRATKHVSYYLTDPFCYYGVLCFEGKKLVIGPIWPKPIEDRELEKFAFGLGVRDEDTQSFVATMKTITHLPLLSLLQILCMVNHILNPGEKLTFADVEILEDAQQSIQNEVESRHNEDELSENQPEKLSTYAVEEAMLTFIRNGQSKQLKDYFGRIPAPQSGLDLSDYTRQAKQTFVTVATLSSRAAIQGGMDANEAMALSDLYIQTCEAEHSVQNISNLQYRMVVDYAERVEKLQIKEDYSPLIIEAIRYIQNHIASAITTEEIASALFVSRSHLSSRFKLETGCGLYQYVTQAKIQEAKRLMRFSRRTLTDIAVHLGFSSQSHFTRVFKQYTEITPFEYRTRLANKLGN